MVSPGRVATLRRASLHTPLKKEKNIDKTMGGSDGAPYGRFAIFGPLEGGRPRSRDGTRLCPAQRPGAPDALAANALIGRNSMGVRWQAPAPRTVADVLDALDQRLAGLTGPPS